MKKNLILFSIFFSNVSFANELQNESPIIDCIFVKQGNKVLIQEGKNCNTEYSPNSTFKIPLAIIGFETDILKSRHTPVWKPKKPLSFLKYYHDDAHSPLSWIRFSVVWYSQILTQKLGMTKLQEYIDKFNYGNKDLSGDVNQENGLTQSWLSSSLKITPVAQIEFIEKLAKNQLPVSKKSQEQTKDLIKLMEESSLANWWSMHGKTGGGSVSGVKEGYFVGFAEKNGEIVSFVIHATNSTGVKAKKFLIEKMITSGIFN